MNSLHGFPPVLRGLVIGTAAIWVLLELRQGITHRPEGVKASWGSEILFRMMVGGGALLAGLIAHMTPSAAMHPANAFEWAGFVILVGGVSLRLWSFHTLGRYFTFTVQTSGDQPVITTGPYRFIRHPSYAGLLLIIVAAGLLIGNWWALACLTLTVAGALVYRIGIEERAMLQNIGGGYPAYAATHKRLVPFIW